MYPWTQTRIASIGKRLPWKLSISIRSSSDATAYLIGPPTFANATERAVNYQGIGTKMNQKRHMTIYEDKIMSTLSPLGFIPSENYLAQPSKPTAQTQTNFPAFPQFGASTQQPSISDTAGAQRRVQQGQRKRNFLFGKVKTAVESVDTAISTISPTSWVAVKKISRRMFDSPTVTAYSNSPKVRNQRSFGSFVIGKHQSGKLPPESKNQQIFLPPGHINYTAPMFPIVRTHTGADLEKLHAIAHWHGAAVSEMHFVPNGFTLATGEKMVCRHLVEQWIDDENLLASGPQCYGQIDSQKFFILENRYKSELIDAGRAAQVVHHTKVGHWLEDMANSLPANCTDIPIRVSDDTHRMGLKISTGTFDNGRRSITIKAYDPNAAKMVSCGPISADAVGKLELKDLFPLHSQDRDAGAFIFSQPSEHKSTPGFRYMPPGGNLASIGNAFVISCQVAGTELFSKLASSIIEGPPEHADAILAYMARRGETSPLITLADIDYNPMVFRRTIDMMKHAGLRGQSAEDYLARIVSISDNIPLPSFLFQQKHAGGVRNFLAALSALNIDKPGMSRLLTQPDALGRTPIHFLCNHLNEQKTKTFFEWAAQNKLSPQEVGSMFLARDKEGTTAIQLAVLAQRDSPDMAIGLLTRMKAYGFSFNDIHALLSVPNKHGVSVISELDSGRHSQISSEIKNWIDSMGQ